MKKLNFLKIKNKKNINRFVYLKGAPEVGEVEIAGVKKQIKENILEGISVEDAVTIAETAIQGIVDSFSVIDLDKTNEELTQDTKSLGRVKFAQKAVLNEIKVNMGNYIKIAAFVGERANLDIQLTNNKSFFDSEVRGKNDLKAMTVLFNICDALNDDKRTIEHMDVPGTGKEKAELIGRISTQSKTFGDEAKRIRDYYRSEISKQDPLLAEISTLLQDPNNVPRADYYMILDGHMRWLKELHKKVGGKGAGELDLTPRTEKKYKLIRETLVEVNKMLMENDSEWKGFRENYAKSMGNLARAEKEMDKVKKKPVADPEKQAALVIKARGWLMSAKSLKKKEKDALLAKGKEIDRSNYPPEAEKAIGA